jgi:hypothetical protein
MALLRLFAIIGIWLEKRFKRQNEEDTNLPKLGAYYENPYDTEQKRDKTTIQ